MVFIASLLYGLLVHPLVFGEDKLPLEIIVIFTIFVTAYYILYLGYGWDHIQQVVVSKISESIPVVLILLTIGVLIGSWIVSGIIPMFIYYGIGMVGAAWF